MNFGELLRTKRWKILMGYVYGWGASIVLIGALFKLQHWNHSGIFLTIGLFTEAIIFFLSAFEPPLEQPDWKRVYPELQDDYQPVEPPVKVHGASKASIDSFLDNTDITPELLSKVSKSLVDLSNTASGISDISTATLATDVYIKNLNSASETMMVFSETNTQANNAISGSIGELVNSYTNTANKISETGNAMMTKLHDSGAKFVKQIDESGAKLTESYSKFSGALEKGVKELENNSLNYGDSLNKLVKNIELLNLNYEKQLKNTGDQIHATSKFFEELNQMNQMIVSSAQEMKKYKENAEKLNLHLESLNSIYGNMLGAMNYKKK